MRFLETTKDGGPDSPVTGLFLIEIKSLFSIVLLKFGGTRENFHSHAFNALTFWLTGRVREEVKIKTREESLPTTRFYDWKAGDIKFTSRDTMHKVLPEGSAWALSFRGPWAKTWKEYNPGNYAIITLSSPGRKIVSMTPATREAAYMKVDMDSIDYESTDGGADGVIQAWKQRHIGGAN